MTRRQKHPEMIKPDNITPGDAVVEVVLLDEDGQPLQQGRRAAEPDHRIELAGAVAARVAQLRQTTATPGARAGGTSDRISRQGCPEEIVTPVLVSPQTAARAAVGPDFFGRSRLGLLVDSSSLEADRHGLRWQASLRTGVLMRRAATLRLYSSPSNNVTVLELIPDVRRFIGTRSFVRAGVPAVAALAERLGSRAPSSSI